VGIEYEEGKMSLIQRIQTFYETEGIAPLSFTCEHKSDCRAGNPHFTGPKVAFVGSRYGSRGLPRLLFLSLDSGRASKSPADRNAVAVRAGTENYKVEEWNPHWRYTNEMALMLLARFDPGLRLRTITRYFAHTNSAKCCQNKEGNQAADARLFRNCRGYIGKELAILCPDVLVTQGKPAFQVIKAAIDSKEISVNRSLAWLGLRSGEHRTLRVDDREVLWFAAFHPRYGGFYTQRERYWRKWSALVLRRFAM
jgi:hypothetical protein